jgi:hypothetical protein
MRQGVGLVLCAGNELPVTDLMWFERTEFRLLLVIWIKDRDDDERGFEFRPTL